MASRASFVPERMARVSRSNLFPITSVMLGDLVSTSDRMKVLACTIDTVDKNRMRDARNIRSGTVDF